MKRKPKSVKAMIRELTKYHKINSEQVIEEAVREKYAADLNI